MIDKRRLHERVTDIMVRVLHYQERGEPDWSTMDYAAIKVEYDAGETAYIFDPPLPTTLYDVKIDASTLSYSGRNEAGEIVAGKLVAALQERDSAEG
jgi:hypothetical protein